MGSGLTTLSDVHRQVHKALEINIRENKPLDASDITDLDIAVAEIKQLRTLLLQLYKVQDEAIKELKLQKEQAADPTQASSATSLAKGRPKGERAAIFAGRAANAEDFEPKFYEKPDDIRQLITNSIVDSVLFKHCDSKELQDLVNAFEPVSFKESATIIKQGEQGDDFYVVESGKLQVFVVFPGSTELVEVRAPYGRGESFGELALMYDNPRAATVKAGCDSKLWSINRKTVRAILTKRKKEDIAQRLLLLGKVCIGDVKLVDQLSKAELQQLADSLETEEFNNGDCIVRQGETGDAFYIIESGEVNVHVKEEDEAGLGKEVTILKSGDYFGERGLLSEETRAASCIAAADGVRCLSLGREDFNRMLGSLQELMARTAGIKVVHAKDQNGTSLLSPSKAATTSDGHHATYIEVKPEDLQVLRTLGSGAFGNVKMVSHAPTGRHFALKCQAKKSILDNDLQQHVLDERRMLMEFDHPFILHIYDSFQDDRYIYFVLELLLGGEMFTHLQQRGQFPEKTAIFYSAAVLHAFRYLHERKVAYRDLKPENLVLDSEGYVKIVDFGLAKYLPAGLTWTICGTPDYLAPEIILNEGHDYAVDYWAFGVLIYEMVAGVPPFYAEDPMGTYEKILGSKVVMPDFLSKNLRDLVRKLLKLNKSKRLGKTRGGTGAVMKHKWYSGFNWDGLIARELEVPIKPNLKSATDASNFDANNVTHEDGPAPSCPEWVVDW